LTQVNGAADNTAQKQQVGRPFEPGQSGNPAGRPKGSRNKVSEKLLETLAEHFETHGKAAVEKVYAESPRDYLKIVAGLVPKQMEIDDKRAQRRAEDLSDDELAAIAAGKPQSNGAGEQHPDNG
jgi:hypothetical protein